tara:strand:- start:347 stop:775 length:429 start_codon:yes stop_codon:yes gene_type:complete
MLNVNDMYRKFFGFKKINESPELEEADLLNHMTDYRGGVVYQLHNPATAIDVRKDIQQFAAKKKMHVIKTQFNDVQGLGFFQFRLGEDPGKESQRIQGFISQLPEVARFKFTTGQGQPTQPQQPQAPQARPPFTPIPPTDIV